MALEVTPQGPGFLIFFQTRKYHGKYGYTDIISARKQKQEWELLLWLIAAYETGIFR